MVILLLPDCWLLLVTMFDSDNNGNTWFEFRNRLSGLWPLMLLLLSLLLLLPNGCWDVNETAAFNPAADVTGSTNEVPSWQITWMAI